MRLQGSFAGGGYDVGSEMGCADVNECAMRSAPLWGDKASCVNLHGGYDYQCPSFDINKYAADEYLCDPHGLCTNVDASFECESGYSGDGFICSDINECLEENACDAYTACDNIAGSHVCT